MPVKYVIATDVRFVLRAVKLSVIVNKLLTEETTSVLPKRWRPLNSRLESVDVKREEIDVLRPTSPFTVRVLMFAKNELKLETVAIVASRRIVLKDDTFIKFALTVAELRVDTLAKFAFSAMELKEDVRIELVKNCDVETTREILEIYPNVPRPTIVDVTCGALMYPNVPKP